VGTVSILGRSTAGRASPPNPLTPRPVPLEPWHSRGSSIFCRCCAALRGRLGAPAPPVLAPTLAPNCPGLGAPTAKVLTLTFARVRNWTVLKGEAALICAVAPAHDPQRFGRRGAPIELSECVRWDNLRPELVGLALAPLPERCVMGLARAALRRLRKIKTKINPEQSNALGVVHRLPSTKAPNKSIFAFPVLNFCAQHKCREKTVMLLLEKN
jgi:hypothetical protein